MSSLLGGGITGHLQSRLQVAEEIALDAGAFYSPLAFDQQTFGIYVVPRPGGGLREAEARLDAAIAAFLEAGPDPEKLARVKTQIRAAQIYALDNQQARASRYGRALTAGLTVDDVAAWPETLQAVTAEDVIAAARALFDPGRAVTGYLMRQPQDMEGSAG